MLKRLDIITASSCGPKALEMQKHALFVHKKSAISYNNMWHTNPMYLIAIEKWFTHNANFYSMKTVNVSSHIMMFRY